MTKKCYAAIKAAQETIPQIEKLSNSNNVNNLKKIHILAQKWNNDFKDVDPTWKNNEQKTSSIPKTIPSPDNFIQK